MIPGFVSQLKTMAALANTVISIHDLTSNWIHGGSSKFLDQSFVNCKSVGLSVGPISLRKAKIGISKRRITVRAGLSENVGRPSSSSIFVGGFLLGGIIAGALGFVYAPKITKALDGADKQHLMKKLPRFIYDEDKALEKSRKFLEEKIAQLNSAIDGVSSELRADQAPNESLMAPEEIEAAI